MERKKRLWALNIACQHLMASRSFSSALCHFAGQTVFKNLFIWPQIKPNQFGRKQVLWLEIVFGERGIGLHDNHLFWVAKRKPIVFKEVHRVLFPRKRLPIADINLSCGKAVGFHTYVETRQSPRNISMSLYASGWCKEIQLKCWKMLKDMEWSRNPNVWVE